MTNTRETAEYAGPEGSIFLPKTERELRNHQLALLLGRGPGQGKTPEEILVEHRAAEEALAALQQNVTPVMAQVAFTPEI